MMWYLTNCHSDIRWVSWTACHKLHIFFSYFIGSLLQKTLHSEHRWPPPPLFSSPQMVQEKWSKLLRINLGEHIEAVSRSICFVLEASLFDLFSLANKKDKIKSRAGNITITGTIQWNASTREYYSHLCGIKRGTNDLISMKMLL